MWSYFLFSILFMLDVIELVRDFYVGDIVSACCDGFYMGMLFMIALDWLFDRWFDSSEK